MFARSLRNEGGWKDEKMQEFYSPQMNDKTLFELFSVRGLGVSENGAIKYSSCGAQVG